MYRLLVLLVVLNIAYCFHCKPGSGCSWKNRHNHTHRHGFGHRCSRHHQQDNQPQIQTFPGTTFEEIARNFIKIDTALKQFCDVNNINRTSEVYGSDFYILKYKLPEFKEAEIDVKVMGRIIYTTANRADGDLKSFKDLRILPDVVKVANAKWIVEHKILKIFVPYYETNWRNKAVKNCDAVTEDAIKSVPKMVNSLLEFRSGSSVEENTEINLEQNEIP